MNESPESEEGGIVIDGGGKPKAQQVFSRTHFGLKKTSMISAVMLRHPSDSAVEAFLRTSLLFATATAMLPLALFWFLGLISCGVGVDVICVTGFFASGILI